MRRAPMPCRKFRNVGPVEFIRHLKETKCRACCAALDYLLDLLDEVERLESERAKKN